MKTARAHSNSQNGATRKQHDFGCDEAETKRWITALMRKAACTSARSGECDLTLILAQFRSVF